MLLLESDWQFQIPHQQSQKYKKPAVKMPDFPFLWGSLGTRLEWYMSAAQPEVHQPRELML